MKQLNELHPYGYGMFLYSPDLFVEFLKAEKCRSKKLLTYFDKHKNIFFKAIENGIALPFYRLSIYYYPIFVSLNEKDMAAPDGWEQVYKYDHFFVQVGGSNKLCFAAFDYLEYYKDLIDRLQTAYSKEIPCGPDEVLTTSHYAIDIDIPEGNYYFDLIAYKRTEPLDESKLENYGKNYAFGFAFRSTKATEHTNLEKCDDEKTVFNIENYCR